MKWKKFTINTTTEAEDLVSMMLNELGVGGVQIEDNIPLSEADTKGMFIDILPELAPDDGTSRLSFFLHLYDEDENVNVNEADAGTGAETEASTENEDTADSDAAADNSYTIDDKKWTEEEIAELLEAVREGLKEMSTYTDIGAGTIEEGTTEDTDWRDNWKQYFKPIEIGSFIIKPSWEDIPESDLDAVSDGSMKVIEIDPGTAFGTGSHETTQLCMMALERIVKEGDRILDIGTGSGILGIAALKCGAGDVLATELDEMCAPSIRDNAEFNSISDEQFRLIIGNVLGDDEVIAEVKENAPGGYDVVIANILAPVIVMLAGSGAVDEFIKKDGIFITSGIIDTKLQDVISAFEANPAWHIEEINERGEWRSVAARRV
ncbi:MAG: 50S ribosomal protein L11 methyltransferase [Eubacteriales bacterium]|nr:50S ribosomal protein L11 methyltransferase [Eubacteriales bacterium]